MEDADFSSTCSSSNFFSKSGSEATTPELQSTSLSLSSISSFSSTDFEGMAPMPNTTGSPIVTTIVVVSSSEDEINRATFELNQAMFSKTMRLREILCPQAALSVQKTFKLSYLHGDDSIGKDEALKFIKQASRADTSDIVDRDDVIRDLYRLFNLWVRENGKEYTALGDISREPHRFHQACYDLWMYNYKFYKNRPIVEQINHRSALATKKHELLHKMLIASDHRLQDLKRVIQFLETLVEDSFEDLPRSDINNHDLLFWAQDAVIAAGPDLVRRLYRLCHRQIRRRDFKIGHAYTQIDTIQKMIDEVLKEYGL